MANRMLMVLSTGPRSADARWPLLQRVRWRFALLTLVTVGVAPFNMVRLADDDGAHLGAYGLAMAGFAVWAVVLYRTGGRHGWLDPVGPLLVVAIGLAAGDHVWSYGTMYILLFLHSMYGERSRVLRNAALHLAAYELVVWRTAGTAELFSDQLVSNALAVLIMAVVMAEMGSSLRRSDDARRRESALMVASRRLLRARELDEVAQAATDGAVDLAAEDGAPAERVSVWWQERNRLTMAASHGRPVETELVDLDEMPIAAVADYLRAQPIRLDPDAMIEAQRAAGVTPQLVHALAVPVTDGHVSVGVIFVETAAPLSDDVIASYERFADEVSLAQRAARRTQLLSGVLRNSADGIVLVGGDCTLTFVSPAVVELAGRDVPVGTPLGQLLSVDAGARGVRDLAEVERDPGSLTIRRPDGTVVEVEVSMRPVAGEGTVLNLRDVSGQRRMQEEITYRAHHDPLTGLPNRALFLDRLERALGHAARHGRQLAVALLDLDNFKAINDALGHLTGDRVLCHVADVMRAHVGVSDTFARLGGDEFALLLEDPDDATPPEQVLERILADVRRPFSVEGHQLALSASCGVVTSSGERSGEAMIGDADLAMYAAKDGGKDAVVLFDVGLRSAVEERRELRKELEVALERGELRLHYQPLLALSGQRPVGVEALVRWQHPVRGLLPPDRFVPLAEEAGLIGLLGRWVLRTACRDLAAWVQDGLIAETFQLHVNLSASQLADPGLVDEVQATLAGAGVRPAQLVLEITETALARDPDAAEDTLRQLHRLGIGIAIDDFGTGYASFTYLRRFPADIVKIDRSFVADVTHGPEESALARAIVRLARSLGMVTVAEGIEEEPTRQLLANWGCEHAQGWLWSPALPASELVPWLQGRGTSSAGRREAPTHQTG